MAIWDHNRTFGVEIETASGNLGLRGVRDLLNAAGIRCETERWTQHERRVYTTFWKVTTDGSLTGLRGGVEVVSPPLNGEAGLEEVGRVLEALRGAGCRTDRKCGIHVHHDARDYRPEDFQKVIRYYGHFEQVIDSGLAKSRRGPHPQWCSSVRGANPDQITASLTSGGTRFHGKKDGPRLKGRVSGGGIYGRMYKINTCAFAAHGTIEFRHHQGSMSTTKITNWIVLTGCIMETARKGRNRAMNSSKGATWAAMRNSILVNRGGRFDGTRTQKALDYFGERIKHFARIEGRPIRNRRRAS